MLGVAWLVLLNEFRLLSRDRVGIFMLLLAPMVIIMVAGLSLGNIYGASPNAGAYSLPLVDEDGGALASAVKSALKREPGITVIHVDSVAAARAAVRKRDRTPLAVVIPAGSTQTLESGGPAQLVLYIDPVKRLEVSAIELRLDRLTRAITAQAHDQARLRLRQQSAAVQRDLDRIARRIRQVQTTADDYQREIAEQRKKAQASLNAQVSGAVAEIQQDTRAAMEQSVADAREALKREMARRRDALLTVSQYLSALQVSQREFDQWFTNLKRMAGSRAAAIPPPPSLPLPPSPEQIAELSKPVLLPDIASAGVSTQKLHLKMPEFPKPPKMDSAAVAVPAVSLVSAKLPGELSWNEHPIDGGSVQPSAFDQYVPGFGITFLLIAMLMAIGMGLIDERDWGTLQRLCVSGASLTAVLSGKLCARFLAGFIQMIVLFAAGRILFGISLGPSPAMLLFPTAAISFAAAAFSLLIACIARTRDSVMPIGAVAAMAMSAAGGCWWPLDFEPGWMRALARSLPTTWTMQAYNDLMIRHVPAATALWPAAYAAGLGCIYLSFGLIAASKLFR
jgi:ABC-type Na+ efflux pump permease subunit